MIYGELLIYLASFELSLFKIILFLQGSSSMNFIKPPKWALCRFMAVDLRPDLVTPYRTTFNFTPFLQSEIKREH